MDIVNRNKVQDLIDNGYRASFENYFSKGFDLFSKEIGLYIGYTFVFVMITLVAAFTIVGPIILYPVLAAGFYLATHKIANGEYLEFSAFFKGFDYFGPLFIQFIIFFVFYIIALAPYFFSIFSLFSSFSPGSAAPDIWGGSMISSMLFYYVLKAVIDTIFFFAPCFVIFGGYGAWEAMDTSRKIIAKNFWLFFGLVIVLALLNMAGAMFCYIGALFTFPATMAIQYAAFREVIGFDDPEDPVSQNDILNHLVD